MPDACNCVPSATAASAALTINDCVYLTRQIQHLIDEKRLLDEDFRLEVSSPGLDYPLREEWQFAKNVGRLLKVQVPGEKGPREISGRLTAPRSRRHRPRRRKDRVDAEIRGTDVRPHFARV